MTSDARLGVIAGSGDLPRRLAEHARAAGRPVFVFGVAGYADPALVTEFGGASASIGEIGKAIDALRAAGCVEVVFAGVVKRPDLARLKLDRRGIALLPKVLAATGKGDDALLRVVLGAFADAGFTVVGADDVLADLLAPKGVFSRRTPSEDDWLDIRRAAEVAREIGRLDIGQGAVSCAGLVLAVEAQEGTDAMLARCCDLQETLRGTPLERRGVLVKRPKPMQERRIDLPTIGVETVRRAGLAGLAGIAVEAGGVLVVNPVETAAAADALGLFLYGFAKEEAG